MNTDDLIRTLSADAGLQRPSPTASLLVALPLALVAAAVFLVLTLGVRADLAAALGTLRFPFKFVVTLSLLASALMVFRHALYPVDSAHPGWPWLLLAPAVLGLGIIAELFATPAPGWQMLAQGKNALLCLTMIPAFGAIPLGLMLWVLRQGAPLRPGLAGIGAGLVAGAIAATFYAMHCPDDSPFFLATWYIPAIGLLAAAGGVLGRVLARW